MSLLLALASPVCTSPADCAGQRIDTFIGTPARVRASVAALVAPAGAFLGGLARNRAAASS